MLKEYKIQIVSRDVRTKTSSIAKIEKLGVNSNGTLSIMCNAGIIINMGRREAHFLKDFLNKHYDEELPINKVPVTKISHNTTEKQPTTVYLDRSDSTTIGTGWDV